MPRIVDCSIAFNELEMLEIRARELEGIATEIVVVEADKTHSGAEKPVLFADEVAKLQSEGFSIVHYVVRDMPTPVRDDKENRFFAEFFQRNSIIRPLSLMNLSDDDIVLISDIDEVPKADAVRQAIELLGTKQIVIFEQMLKRYFLNNAVNSHQNNAPWLGTVCTTYGWLKHVSPQAARVGDPLSPRAACPRWGYSRDLYPYEGRVWDAGWHFTSMGGLESHRDKMRNVAEGYSYDGATTFIRHGRHNHVEFRAENKAAIDAFFQSVEFEGAPVNLEELAALSEMDLPKAVLKDPRRFEHLFWLDEPITG